MKPPVLFKILLALGSLAPALAFGSIYIESVNGDLSGNRLSPTVFSLTSGTNTLSGTVVSGDVDYLTFNIPASFVFQSLTLNSYTGTGTLTKSFIGIQSGTTFTVTPAAATPADLLGYTHFGPSGATGSILDDIGTGAGATGFTPPLPSGNYTFWIQETGGQARNYSFTLNMTPIPEPSDFAICLAGFLAAWIGRREFRKHARAS